MEISREEINLIREVESAQALLLRRAKAIESELERLLALLSYIEKDKESRRFLSAAEHCKLGLLTLIEANPRTSTAHALLDLNNSIVELHKHIAKNDREKLK